MLFILQEHCVFVTLFAQTLLFSSDCEDNPSANCPLYKNPILCDSQGIYYPWARKNCPLHCGFCQSTQRLLSDVLLGRHSNVVDPVANGLCLLSCCVRYHRVFTFEYSSLKR